MKPWLLTCCKTGRYWRYMSEWQCRRAAATLGLVDFTTEKAI